jgi:pimeloyl-ACP methyl ester carboxylesterase
MLMTTRKRFFVALGVIALATASLSLARSPLQRAAAHVIVTAPNQGKGAPAPLPGEIRIDVGPPRASLAITIQDPTSQPMRGTVFLLHGIRDRKESMRAWARMLANAGFRAVLVDLRGHGRSTGDFLSYGVVESRDLVQTLDALTSRGIAVGPIGVMGLSYGAATAIEWAGIDTRVAAVVAVAPFASLRAVAPGYVPVQLPSSFVNGAVDLAGARGGFDPDDASPVRAITRTHARVLLIHGDGDARIPYWHSALIAAAGDDHTTLVRVRGVGHNGIVSDPDGTIARRAPAWFGETLAAP